MIKIELHASPEITPVIEIVVPRPHNLTLEVRVLTPSPTTADKSTR